MIIFSFIKFTAVKILKIERNFFLKSDTQEGDTNERIVSTTFEESAGLLVVPGVTFFFQAGFDFLTKIF